MQQTGELPKKTAGKKLWLDVVFCLIQAILTFMILILFSPSISWAWIAIVTEAFLALTVPALITFAVERQFGNGFSAGFFTGLRSTIVVCFTCLFTSLAAFAIGIATDPPSSLDFLHSLDAFFTLLSVLFLFMLSFIFAVCSLILGCLGGLIGVKLGERVKEIARRNTVFSASRPRSRLTFVVPRVRVIAVLLVSWVFCIWVSQSVVSFVTVTSQSGRGYYDIACPSMNTCFATGRTVIRTTDGGQTWTSVGSAYFSPIACPSPSTCFTASYDIQNTTDGGKTWTRQKTGTIDSFIDIACPSTSTCFAIGGRTERLRFTVMGTTDGGSTWRDLGSNRLNEFNPDTSIESIACPSTSTCFVSSSTKGMLSTTDGGQTWTSSSPTIGFGDIACPSTSTCFASTSSGVLKTTDGGSTWIDNRALPLHPTTIACPNASTCFAVAVYSKGEVWRTTDGGSTWTDQTKSWRSTTHESYPYRLACPSTSTCFATSGDGVLKTTDGGRTWTSSRS